MNEYTVSNRNYCCTVVEIKTLMSLAKCDNVQGAMIFGNNVIVGKDVKPGDIGLFFPVETALSQEFLSNNNLYREATLNKDPAKKGYFEQHGRIRAVSFRSHRSEGFFIPLSSLAYLNLAHSLQVGDEFNEIGQHKICEKYIPKSDRVKGDPGTKKNKESVKVSRLCDNQLCLHYETESLKKNMDKIHPHDIISLSDKIHGCSFGVAKILTTRKMTLLEKLLNKYFKIPIKTETYDVIYHSRKVIKNGFINSNPSHFYNYDLWKDISDKINELIPESYAVYGEAIGYLPSGGMIQKGYHYSCKPNEYDIRIYRVTTTNSEGRVLELSWPQMKEFCDQRGLKTVTEFYYGKAGDIPLDLPDYTGDNLREWQEAFLAELIECKSFNLGNVMCKANDYSVPAEGCVLRKDSLNQSSAFKIKNYKFLAAESILLDSEEPDLETDQTIVVT